MEDTAMEKKEFDLTGIFKDSLVVLRANLVLCIPAMVLGTARILFFLSPAIRGAMHVGQTGGGGPTGPDGRAIVFLIFFSVLSLFVHGVAVGMANDALKSGRTSLLKGLEITSGLFVPLATGAALLALLIFTGASLFILPGLIVGFLFMFMFPAIIRDGLSPVNALKMSYAVVRGRLADSLKFAIVLVVIMFFFGFLEAFVGVLPVLGRPLAILISGFLGGYVPVAMVLAYIELGGQKGQVAATPPDTPDTEA